VGRSPEEVIIFLPFRVRLELEKLAKSRRSALAARALELNGPRIVWQSAMDYARDLAFMDELVMHVRRSTNMIVAVASGDDHILRNTLLLRAYAEEYEKSVVFYTNDREFQGKMRRNGVPTYVSPQLELR
jgi:rRNA-processing protein FCF1